MAIDTDTRKFSAMNPMCPWRGIGNIPSGALDEPEQFSLLYLYNEFAAGAPPASGTTVGHYRASQHLGLGV